jgi:DNA-binding CsgD family transcriptional regulator
LVKEEVNYYLEQCNFTEEEEQYFLLRAKDISNVKTADVMHISVPKVSAIAKRVKRKLNKVGYFK